jgi:hypothetical protein
MPPFSQEHKMIRFHAVFIDETGHGEFGATIEAETRAEAWELAREDYPESRCVQLESPEDTAKREAAMYNDISRGIYRNEDGSIEFQEPGYDDYEDEEE